jgi:UDP-glucose 4-epimerase
VVNECIKSVAVIGGAGFIGSHFTKAVMFEFPNVELLVVDNFSSGSRAHIESELQTFGGSLKEVDLKNRDETISALKGVDLVAHFAANPNIAAAETQPDIDFWEGTLLTQNLLEAMRLGGAKYLIYASGSGVYGEAVEDFSEDYGPCQPISTYGASKLACESMISAYCHMFGLRARTLRFANVVGPKQTHGIGHDLIRKLIKDPSHLQVLGDGSQSKSYIHVDDVVRAMLRMIPILQSPITRPYDVFNVATDDYVSVKEIAEDIAKLISPDATLEFGKEPRGWKGDVPVVRFDTMKIKSLGWKAQQNSSSALRSSIRSMAQELELNLAEEDL